MKTPSQLTEEAREVSGGQQTLVAVVAIMALLLFAVVARANVLQLQLGSALTADQRAMAGRVGQWYNNWIVDNGMLVTDQTVNVQINPVSIDGRWNVLAQTYASVWAANSRAKYVLVGAGRIELDTADLPFLSSENFAAVIFHELMHCFGFNGVIWLYNGNMPTPGEYTGPMGLAAYQTLAPGAQFVPMAEDHFAQVLSPWLGTPALTGTYISPVVLQIFADNGYNVRAGFRGGPLLTVLPRRALGEPIILP